TPPTCCPATATSPASPNRPGRWPSSSPAPTAGGRPTSGAPPSPSRTATSTPSSATRPTSASSSRPGCRCGRSAAAAAWPGTSASPPGTCAPRSPAPSTNCCPPSARAARARSSWPTASAAAPRSNTPPPGPARSTWPNSSPAPSRPRRGRRWTISGVIGGDGPGTPLLRGLSRQHHLGRPHQGDRGDADDRQDRQLPQPGAVPAEQPDQPGEQQTGGGGRDIVGEDEQPGAAPDVLRPYRALHRGGAVGEQEPAAEGADQEGQHPLGGRRGGDLVHEVGADGGRGESEGEQARLVHAVAQPSGGQRHHRAEAEHGHGQRGVTRGEAERLAEERRIQPEVAVDDQENGRATSR